MHMEQCLAQQCMQVRACRALQTLLPTVAQQAGAAPH